jgi:hypothetical protein
MAAPEPLAVESVGIVLASLTGDQLAEVAQRARHVCEVLTSDPDGNPGVVAGSLGERMQAKAAELGVTVPPWSGGWPPTAATGRLAWSTPAPCGDSAAA